MLRAAVITVVYLVAVLAAVVRIVLPIVVSARPS